MQKRNLLRAGLALGLAGVAPSALAQSSQVTRILVGFPPGQATDSVARILADRLKVALGHAVIVENRPGQGGSLALTQLMKSPTDGSVLSLSALAAYVVNPPLYKNLSYDSLRDFSPVARVADLPMVLVVHPSVPANNVKELVALVKANPEKYSHSSSGNGTLSHLQMEDFKARAGIRIQHIPYQGSPRAMIDLAGGIVQVALDTATVTQPLIKGGKLKLIAAGSRQRLEAFPDTPTFAESGFPGFEAVAWIALTAPAGTPRDIRERLNAEVNKALQDGDVAAKLATMGAVPRPASVDEFGAFLQAEQRRWKDLVESSGVKPD